METGAGDAMAAVTLTALPIYKRIEATKQEDGLIVLRLLSRAYVGSTPVDVVTVLGTGQTPEEWDGTRWETAVAPAVEADYSAAGYDYPA